MTIKKSISLGGQLGYILTYPNIEVRSSLNAHFMQLGNSLSKRNETFYSLIDALNETNFDALKTILSSHFASIPHDWYRNNSIGQYEGFYASMVYSCFAALGYEVHAEDSTNIGKIDLSINAPDKVIIIEFKLSKYGSAQHALQQIKDKQYADKFKSLSKPIYLIGMSFDEEQKQVKEVMVEQLQNIEK